MDIDGKVFKLKEIIGRLGSVLVAYSGGVDSTLLLKFCIDILGKENVLACMAADPLEPRREIEQAVKTAAQAGAELQLIRTARLNDREFTANTPKKCYYCKVAICRELKQIASEKGFEHVVFGTNADDLQDYRPGNKAMEEQNIVSPLMEAGLRKAEIRLLSEQLKLPTAQKPATPCLASRIAYGIEITAERLEQVERAEDILAKTGLELFRVRHHGDLARIELPPEKIAEYTALPMREKIMKQIKEVGFKFVTIDLAGFRSGSLNESLTEQQIDKYRQTMPSSKSAGNKSEDK